MAVGLTIPRDIEVVQGVELAAVTSGVKKNDLSDLVLLSLSEGTQTAGVFTRNAFCAAPVVIAKKNLQHASPRAFLINSGNANAGTGIEGLRNTEKCCHEVARKLSIQPEQVLPFSTGVISQQLPVGKILSGIAEASTRKAPKNWLLAAQAIMTTDTVPKIVSRKVLVAGTAINITGMCKGAGMIRPDMATMLAFIATDAHVAGPDLQVCLQEAVQQSFNAISIDGDTSTNDACMLSATGKAGGELLTQKHAEWQDFQTEVNGVCRQLAQAIVRDGEGATKFITINITQAQDKGEAREVAYTLAHSPLVKTAFYASDPNIGRILAAIGRSKIKNFDINNTNVSLDEVDIFTAGEQAESYSEARGQQVMDREEITINVKLGRGEAVFTLWTCDLSNEYVRINAEYRS